MAIFTLIPHPDHPPLAARGVTVEIARDGDGLRLDYRVDGASRTVWPPAAPPVRTDELWRTTCFELFVKTDDRGGYAELNFSPSGRWAAYAFDSHRNGMRALALSRPPRIERRVDGIAVTCPLSGEHAALTAVVEEEGGHRSFWSLAHPCGVPDFHHDDCFVTLPPALGRP